MKFYALIVTTELQLQRMWLDEQTAAAMLKERKDIKIYWQAYDQEAVLQEDGSVLWKVVKTVEKL